MIPEHWHKKAEDRLKFADPKVSKGIEDFLNNSEIKIFKNRMRREKDTKSILIQINLEERRNRLRSLIEEEDQMITDEHMNRIETTEMRRDRLREYAKRIRNQKEIERQAMAEEKYRQRDCLSNDDIRLAQSKLHLEYILKDWEKLKDIKERIRREEQCEKEFWAYKNKEENERLLQRFNEEESKQKSHKDDLLNQIHDNEARRKIEYEKELEQRKINAENIKNLQSELEQEAVESAVKDRNKKMEFRKGLDRQIKLRNGRIALEKDREKAFDMIMEDENETAMKAGFYKSDRKRMEALKHLKHFLHEQHCVREGLKAEKKIIEDMVTEKYIETNKKFAEQNYLQFKKYLDLSRAVRESYEANKIQMEKEKILKALERQKEKEEMIEFIRVELEKEKVIKEKEKQIKDAHNKDLNDQIIFNSRLKDLAKLEEEKELNSMKATEENHKQRLKEMKDAEELRFKHPWRQNINEFN